MKKVCIITATRSEYGLLRWIMEGVKADPELELQVIATGSHLSKEFGETYRFIEEDGFVIDEKVDMKLATESVYDITRSMGYCSIGMSDALERLKPDMIVVLGDRYELLPIASAALVLRIPIAHISGGDVTEGAIDNRVRNAVTMMSTYHFPGTEESAARIKRMIGTDDDVYVTGETNLDNFRLLPKLSREELAESLSLDSQKEWILCTFHSETVLSLEENMNRVQNLLQLFTDQLYDFEIIITKSNADFGGMQINEHVREYCSVHHHCHQFDSLGLQRYISMLSQVRFMIGNSSSGIFESPVVGVPVINIGDRQKGRHLTANIFSSDGTYESLVMLSKDVLSKTSLPHHTVENPYGDGYGSERIYQTICKILNDK